MRRFTITTLGCKVNQYDGFSLAQALLEAGFTPANPGQTPDLAIINTCCITTVAMRKSRQAIRRAIRSAPLAIICVVGCYSDYHKDRIREIFASMGVPPQRAFIAGHHDNLADLLMKLADPTASQQTPAPAERVPAVPKNLKTRRKLVVEKNQPAATAALPFLHHMPGHQRAFVKVQDGCDAFCSYCIVPFTRAKVWSRPIEDVVGECRGLIATGHREIVLCGVFLGAYGRNSAIRRNWSADQGDQLSHLLRVISELPDLWRVRLSSLEPGDLTDELLAVARDCPTVAPHFHLPLQSGSEKILRKMNRQYTADQFRETVDRLRETLTLPALTTDIIVGFPGETNDDFAETLAVARHAGFAKIHAFPFSAIEPTTAWRHRHEAPDPKIARERLERLAELETDMATRYRQQFVGKTVEALVENTLPANPDTRDESQAVLRQAMTDRYLTVTFSAPKSESLTGQIVTLRIQNIREDGLAGTRKT